MGMLAAIGAWFTAKEIPWKWIGVGILVLIVAGVLVGGYMHIDGLKNDLVQAKSDLAKEQILKQEAIARADDIMTQHTIQVERINNLESQRNAIASEVMTLRQTIQNLDIEEDLASDNAEKADGAIDRLNARNRELNGLLDRASGKDVVRANPGAGSKAGKADTPSALQRALEALR